MIEKPAGDLALLARARRKKAHAHWFVLRTNIAGEVCDLCGLLKDDYLDRQRRGRLANRRGKDIQRKRITGLGGRNLAGNNPNLDGLSELFASESKSGGAFSERYWKWLKGIRLINAQQVPILIVTDTPGSGRRARSIVIVDYDDWKELHGE